MIIGDLVRVKDCEEISMLKAAGYDLVDRLALIVDITDMGRICVTVPKYTPRFCLLESSLEDVDDKSR